MSDLDIRIFQDGWQWALRAAAEVELWSGTKHLGSLPGQYVVMLIANELNRLALMTYFQEKVGGAPLRNPADAPEPTPTAVAPVIRAARRAKRRGRRK